MSRFIALDAEQGQLYLASVIVKGSDVKLEKAISIPDVGALSAANAGDLGRRIKEAMKEAGIPPAPAVACIGRERVVLKEVKYPASVGATEEPALVRFQVAKELAEGGDSVVIDYFALPTPDPDGQRRALAFAIRKDILASLRAVGQAAGLKILAVTPRPFGIAAALMRAIKDGAVTPTESPVAPIAILVRGDKWGELVILRGGQVAFTRSLTGLALNSESAMLGEIRRNLAVFAGQSSQPVQALFVAEGDMPGGWSGRVRAGLTIPVQSFDPIAGVDTPIPPETRGCFAGLAGLAFLRSRSSELPVNFVEPREPKQQSDPNKRMLGLVGAALAILLVGGLGIGLFMVSKKSDEVAALQKQKTGLEEEIKNLEEVNKRVDAVKKWEDKGVNWLDEEYDLTCRFPDTRGTEVVQLTGRRIETGGKAATKWTAEMELILNTESGSFVDYLTSRISQDKHYSVGGKVTKGTPSSTGVTRNNKNQQFSLKVQIERRDPNQYTLVLDQGIVPPSRRDKSKFDRNMNFGQFGGGNLFFPEFGGQP